MYVIVYVNAEIKKKTQDFGTRGHQQKARQAKFPTSQFKKSATSFFPTQQFRKMTCRKWPDPRR
jgi:hypothetical protein